MDDDRSKIEHSPVGGYCQEQQIFVCDDCIEGFFGKNVVCIFYEDALADNDCGICGKNLKTGENNTITW